MVKNIKLDEHKICTFKNISDFDFTPELGAMFGGRPYFVKSGEELLAPEPIAWRLAVNLAKAMLVKAMPAPDLGKGDDKSTLGAFSEEKVEELVAKIIPQSYVEDKPKALTEDDKMHEKIKELMSWKESMEKDSKEVSLGGFADKQEVIDELEKRGIKFDRRKSKKELEKLIEPASA